MGSLWGGSAVLGEPLGFTGSAPTQGLSRNRQFLNFSDLISGFGRPYEFWHSVFRLRVTVTETDGKDSNSEDGRLGRVVPGVSIFMLLYSKTFLLSKTVGLLQCILILVRLLRTRT